MIVLLNIRGSSLPLRLGLFEEVLPPFCLIQEYICLWGQGRDVTRKKKVRQRRRQVVSLAIKVQMTAMVLLHHLGEFNLNIFHATSLQTLFERVVNNGFHQGYQAVQRGSRLSSKKQTQYVQFMQIHTLSTFNTKQRGETLG